MEGQTWCVGCKLPVCDDHLKRVYGEWEHQKDYLRCVVDDGIDKYQVCSFDLSDTVSHTKGCAFSFMYDVKQSIMERSVPHFQHMLWKHRHRELDLPVQRKPPFMVLVNFRCNKVGVTRQQFELLETTYPFLSLQHRRGRDFIQYWPNERNVFSTGDKSILQTLSLHQLPEAVLNRLVLKPDTANVGSGVVGKPNDKVMNDKVMDDKNPTNVNIPPHNNSQNGEVTLQEKLDVILKDAKKYVVDTDADALFDFDGDPDDDVDTDLDISLPHPTLDSDDDVNMNILDNTS